jgi:uncharacterized phage protein gp47/JayE
VSVKKPKNQKELVDSAKTDFQRENQTSNPFLRNSFLGALLTGITLRVWDFFVQLTAFEKELFLPTTTRFLPVFGIWYNVTRNQATQATGSVVATGTATTIIPISTQLLNTNGDKYVTTSAGTIINNVISVTSLVRSGTTVTATTAVDHEFASQNTPTIAGAVETDYNGTFSITVTGSNTFTYQVSTTPSTPATGTITATQDSILIPVESVDFGSSLNINAGEALTLSSPIAGADSNLRADYAGVGGGADAEADEDYRARILERVHNPLAHFNEADIIQQAKQVPGVTRVWPKPTTPAAGQVTVYFVRDNDASIIPSAGEITTTKNKILEIKPVSIDDTDVIVSAPTAVPSNFAFTAISPDTTTMREAITASINANAKKQNEGEDWREDDYRAAINGTVDRVTNAELDTFTLTLTGDVTIAAGEIATVGTISF